MCVCLFLFVMFVTLCACSQLDDTQAAIMRQRGALQSQRATVGAFYSQLHEVVQHIQVCECASHRNANWVSRGMRAQDPAALVEGVSALYSAHVKSTVESEVVSGSVSARAAAPVTDCPPP